MLLIRRIAHPIGLKVDTAGHPFRYIGNGSNILATVNLMVCLGVNILSNLPRILKLNLRTKDYIKQYMALISIDPAREPAYGTPEFEAMM